MDEQWTKHFNVSNEEWEKICDKALDTWDKLDVPKDPDDLLESNTCPMHPNTFMNLSGVSGFNNMNGYTYEDYVAGWTKRVSLEQN